MRRGSERSTGLVAALVYLGCGLFVGAVTALQLAQPGHDPFRQRMSELALGRFGGAMLAAFLSFGLAAFAAGLLVLRRTGRRMLAACLLVAALAHAGAGVFSLADAPRLHVSLVALAAAAQLLAMTLAPVSAAGSAPVLSRFVSWGLTLVAAGLIGLPGTRLPPGLAQRATAGVLLLWLLVLAKKLGARASALREP